MKQLAERTQGLNFPLSKEERNRIDLLKKTGSSRKDEGLKIEIEKESM